MSYVTIDNSGQEILRLREQSDLLVQVVADMTEIIKVMMGHPEPDGPEESDESPFLGGDRG